ncbi:diguanylate cyclase [Streptomyces sp. ST2-7A]|uniref:GGDEF domain-containing protein n=1 Tax=Streptomyces sp. ST2-7A TaxID=2907214 RepID=UPI001F162E2A|nr:GGDEF domain-containing protein [Streptomyces sp. ST2-7A]MCE7082979.1 GGDEF domain-containing protein [Streptomyces sp. ST2-7A]
MNEDRRLRAVTRLAEGLAGTTGLPEAARLVAEHTREALAADSVAVLLADVARRPRPGRRPVPLRPLAIAGSPGAGLIAPGRRPDSRRATVPLPVTDRLRGELRARRASGDPAFADADLELLRAIAALAGTALIQQERLDEAHRLARTDALTGLANRRLADDRLAEALAEHHREGTVVCLAVFDLNGLKQVNDTLGHATGDRLLRAFADLLTETARRLPGALAARLGGDEFCVVTIGTGGDELLAAARHICRRAAAPGFAGIPAPPPPGGTTGRDGVGGGGEAGGGTAGGGDAGARTGEHGMEGGSAEGDSPPRPAAARPAAARPAAGTAAARAGRIAGGTGGTGGAACGLAGTDEPIGPPLTARRLLRLADAAQYRAKTDGLLEPVVAGRGAVGREVVRLADAAAPRTPDRRALRGGAGPRAAVRAAPRDGPRFTP